MLQSCWRFYGCIRCSKVSPGELWTTGIHFVLGLSASGLQSRQGESRLHFLSLRPIVVGVALEASRLSVLRPGCVASLAVFDSRHQNVARLFARQRFRVTSRARKSAMRIVVKLCMWEPALRYPRFRNLRERIRHLLLSFDGIGNPSNRTINGSFI